MDRVILKVTQFWKPNLFEVKSMCDQWKFEVPEQRLGVPNPDREVCKLNVVYNHLDKSLLPLDGGEDSPELRSCHS